MKREAEICVHCGVRVPGLRSEHSEAKKGFFGALFDFSFSSMVTVRIVGFLYALAIIGIGIFMLLLLAASLDRGGSWGIIFFLLSPLIFILMVIWARLWFESMVVLFKIAENTADTAENTRRR